MKQTILRMQEAKVAALMNQFVRRIERVAAITESSDSGDTKQVGIVGVFRRRGDKLQVLLGKRAYDPEAGQWALPGGHCKKGETAEEGAKREIKEETGLEIEGLTFYKKHESDDGETVHLFSTLYTGKEQAEADDETKGVKWADVDNLPEGLAFDNNTVIPAMAKAASLTEAYAGFNADRLNSDQPLPAKRAMVYKTLHKPWADAAAQEMRDKYGINVWVDGTVTTGWSVLVHAGDGARARRMFLSILPIGSTTKSGVKQ